jgi:hypothetical protein
MLNFKRAVFIIFIFSTMSFSQILRAEEVKPEETEVEAPEDVVAETDQPKWHSSIKEKYALTDEQMKTLKDSGLNYPQIVRVAQLAKSSSKPIGDILAMRVDQKMGWGKIAKELGVPPGELGKAIASMRQERHERLAKRAEKRQDKIARAAEKRERRVQRHADHKANGKTKEH